MSFESRRLAYVGRVDHALDRALPAATAVPERLHAAMRYAVLNGGKRVRPLLVYATGEVFGTAVELLDAPAVAIELMHAFSLVHDDLPAMDDDDLRRGKPTVHREFDEATAILAADALQPLAFEVLCREAHGDNPRCWLDAIEIVARACGSLGMTGGQAIDLESEGKSLGLTELEHMHAMKTGCLIRASVESACAISPGCDGDDRAALVAFARALGLAFQIRDDILDVEGETAVIGKTAGADVERGKATWPALFGLERSRRRADELLANGLEALARFGEHAEPLRTMAGFIVSRAH